MSSPFFSLLPCSSEIWLPEDEDSLLNIESEAIIPETGLSSQVVLDYEYKYNQTSSSNNFVGIGIGGGGGGGISEDRTNSIRYGTYRSKLNSSRAELKPDGVVLVHVAKTNESSARFGLRLRRGDGDEFLVQSIEIGAEAHRLGLFQVYKILCYL